MDSQLIDLPTIPLCYIAMHMGNEIGLLFQLCKSLYALHDDPIYDAMRIWNVHGKDRPLLELIRFMQSKQDYYNKINIMTNLQFVSHNEGNVMIVVCAAIKNNIGILHKNQNILGKALGYCIQLNNISAVNILIGLGAVIFICDLEYAIDYSNDNIVLAILSTYPTECNTMNLAINRAFIVGRTNVLRNMIRNKSFRPNQDHLYLACENGHAEIVIILLYYGILPLSCHMHVACINGHLRVVKTLVNIAKMKPVLYNLDETKKEPYEKVVHVVKYLEKWIYLKMT